MKAVLAGGFLALIGLAGLHPAQAASPCGTGYGAPQKLDLGSLLTNGASLSHVWGRSNLQPTPDGGLRVNYPQGSINPGNDGAPEGGGGFLYATPQHAAALCLSYRVRFPQGFDFVKGGKLPGLYGGDAPRGCVPADLASGFSARLMWRSGGTGELYLYAPDRSMHCGDSIGRGAFSFTPGQWTDIAEEVVMNHPGQSDGVVRVWADGQPVIAHSGLTLAADPQIGVDGLIFSTFFGGHDPSWASPSDQYAEFTGFTLWAAGASP